MKLLSVSAELRAIKSICSAPTKTSSRLLAVLQPTHFQYPAAKEAFMLIRKQAKQSGEVPDWTTLCNEPALDVSTRRALKGTSEEVIDYSKIRSLVNVLEKYRKLRTLLDAGKKIMDTIGGEKANPDELIDTLGTMLTNARINTDAKQTLFHLGAGNNSSALLKQLLYGKAPPMVPTGYKGYDDRNGGFLNGSLVLIGSSTGGGKCLVGTSLVPTSDGLLTLEELHDSSATEFIPKTTHVYDIHGGADTDATYSTHGLTLVVETEHGDYIEGLFEHKLLGETGFVSLSQLKIGDWIAKPEHTRLFAQNPTTEIDGVPWTYELVNDAVRAFCGGDAQNFLISKFRKGIPFELRTAAEEFQSLFVEILWNHGSVESKSRTKLLQLKALCDNLGIPVILEQIKRCKKSHKPGFSLKFIDAYSFEIPGKDVFCHYLSCTEFPQPLKTKLLELIPLAKENFTSVCILWAIDLLAAHNLVTPPIFDELLAHQQWVWTKVKSIKVGKYSRVYDLSVPASRSYCVQGVMSHNTSMAVNLTRNMSEFYSCNCALVSLEMSAEQMLARLKAILTGIPVGKITLHKLTTGEKTKVKEAYTAFVEKLKENNTRYTIHTPDADGLEDILYTLQPLGYDVICIDYVSLLKGANSTNEASQWEKLGEITKFAKRYAERNGIIVILLVQVSKEGVVKYSRTMVEDANHVWLWVAPQEESDVVTLEIQQLKARNLTLFPFQLSSISATGLITDVDSAPGEPEEAEPEKSDKPDYMVDLNDEQTEA